MKILFFIFTFSLASSAAMAEDVPALIVGGSSKVALQDIVSVKFDNNQISILKKNGITQKNDLATLTFGTTSPAEGIRQVSSEDQTGRYSVYDLGGRLVKNGNASGSENFLSGLAPGTYILRFNGRSMKVHTSSAGTSLPISTPVSYTVSAAATRAFASVSTDVAMQIGTSGIDPMSSLSVIDSLTFSSDQETMNVIRNGANASFDIAGISDITFPTSQSAVSLVYSDASVEGVNPFYFDGVSISPDGAGVVVNSTYEDEVEYDLSGSSSCGYFKIYSAKKWEAVLLGLNLTNPNGPVINGQSGKKGTIHIQKGYENTLCDGSTYASSTEDQKGCIFSNGQLVFNGKGTLNVSSLYKHGICSDDYVSIENGTINVLKAVGDAIHANDSVIIQGGTTSLVSSSDGIDCDSLIIIREGENGVPTLGITNAAVDVKGIKAGGNMIIEAGNIAINMSGNAGKGIKSDGTLTIGRTLDSTGPALMVTTTGSSSSGSSYAPAAGWGGGGGWNPGGGGGKGGGGSTSSTSSSKAIKAMGTAYIYGGQLTVNTSKDGAEGLESKSAIYIYGGQHYFKCYDDCLNSSGIISFNGGTTACWSTGNDAVDSNYGRSGAITIAGGNIFAYTTKGSPEEGFDCDNNSYLKITGGIAVSAGASQGGGGGSSSIGSSNQGYCLSTTSMSYSSSTYYTLCNTSGEPVCTYKFGSTCSSSLSLFTAANLGKGSFTIKSGTAKPTAFTDSAGDAFFISPTVATTSTFKTLTSK